MRASEQLIREALRAGARGYLVKLDATRFIVSAVEALAQHKPYLNCRASETVLDAFLRGTSEPEGTASDRPTGREREVVQLIAEGRSSRQISSSLDISIKTVETHRATIMRKLNAHSVVEIVRYALRNNLTLP